jgi:3',5'-cyclic AMP phosphodiesterase CpdA
MKSFSTRTGTTPVPGLNRHLPVSWLLAFAAGASSLLAACGDDEWGPPRDASSPDTQPVSVSVLPGPKLDAETDLGTVDISRLEAGSAGIDLAVPTFNCPAVPTAYFMDYADPFTGLLGTQKALTEAGFDVQPLPLDQSPTSLKGLIVFGSFSSTSPDYVTYMGKYAADLYGFVDRGNVLVQMDQADQTEVVPPFLPTTEVARRGDLDLGQLYVLNPLSPLLAGVRVAGSYLAWQGGYVGWETFDSQGGFEVDLAADATGKNPALMQAAYGQGRIVLVSMSFDKDADGNPERPLFRQAFFSNLLSYVTSVCQRTTPALNITPSAQGTGFQAGAYTFAVLPDTQVYALLYPGLYDAQTAWIAENAKKRNIVYALQLGDITNNNTATEWQRAVDAFSLIDNIVPYAIVPGNHDYGPAGNAADRTTLMNDYFSYQRISAWPTFGGAYETGKLDNTYHLFSVGKRDFILLALEWGPRDEVIAWANQLMDNQPDRWGIMITHAYLNNDDLRYDYTDTTHPQDFDPHFYATPGVNDGEELWQKLVRKHKFIMVLNGHVLGDGTGYLASMTDTGITCHQMLSNYQFRNLGGEDYMRLVEFQPDGTTVRVSSYSPLYDSYLTDADQSYSFTLDWPAVSSSQ